MSVWVIEPLLLRDWSSVPPELASLLITAPSSALLAYAANVSLTRKSRPAFKLTALKAAKAVINMIRDCINVSCPTSAGRPAPQFPNSVLWL